MEIMRLKIIEKLLGYIFYGIAFAIASSISGKMVLIVMFVTLAGIFLSPNTND